MKRQSDLVRDLTDPGWREREAARNAQFLSAIPIKKTPASFAAERGSDYIELRDVIDAIDEKADLAAPVSPPLQAGLTNAELLAAWKKKLPGAEPTERELSAFALGVEVGFDRAQDLERQAWNRVHHVIAKHGLHPGRTDVSLVDVIDRALAQVPKDEGGAA